MTLENSVSERIYQELNYWMHATWSFKAVEAHYDVLAADYDAINEGADSYFRRFTDAMRLARVPDDAHVLDLCARTGNGAAYFYQQGKVRSAVCADVSTEMGRLCRQRLDAIGLRNYHWQQITSYEWPFADGEFDVVLSLETVEHFDDPHRFIQELSRVTKTEGTLLFSTPNVLWEPVHALAAITGLHHSEGPHRFVPRRRLRAALTRAGFYIKHAETTVLIPAGPGWLLDAGKWLEERIPGKLMSLIGLRHFFICEKLP